MSQNRTVSLFSLLLIMAILMAICLVIFTEPTSSAQPKEKSRKLTPAEQRDSVK